MPKTRRFKNHQYDQSLGEDNFLLCRNTVRLDLLDIVNKQRRTSESVMSLELLFMFVWNRFFHTILPVLAFPAWSQMNSKERNLEWSPAALRVLVSSPTRETSHLNTCHEKSKLLDIWMYARQGQWSWKNILDSHHSLYFPRVYRNRFKLFTHRVV